MQKSLIQKHIIIRTLLGIAVLFIAVGDSSAQEESLPYAPTISLEASSTDGSVDDLRVIALEKMLSQTRQEVETQTAYLEQRNAEITALRSAVSDRDELLDEYDAASADQEAMHARLDDLVHQNNVLREEIVRFHADLETQQTLLSTRDAELSALKSALQDRDELLEESDIQLDELTTKANELGRIRREKDKLNQRLQRQEADIADLKEDLQINRQKQNDLLTQISSLQMDKKDCKQTLDQQKQQMSELNAALANHDMLLKVVGQSEVTLADKDAELSSNKTTLDQTEKTLDELRSELTKQSENFNADRTNLVATIDGYRDQVASLQQEQLDKQNQIEELGQLSIQDQEVITQLKTESQELQAQNEALLASLVQRENEASRLKDDIAQRDDVITTQQDEANKLKQEKGALLRVNEKNKSLTKSINRLEEAIRNYKRQLAKANGEITRGQKEIQQLTRLRKRDQSERKAWKKEQTRFQSNTSTTDPIETEETSIEKYTVRPTPAGFPLGEQVTDANRELRLGNLAEAERLFQSVLNIDARQPGALLGLGSCYYAARNYDKAYTITEQLLDENSLDGHALALQGLIDYKKGDLATAAVTMEKAIMLRPDDAKLNNYMGMIFYAQKRYKRAARNFQESIDLNPSSSDAHRNLALVTITASPDNKSFARQHYEEALRLGGKSDTKLEALIYAD